MGQLNENPDLADLLGLAPQALQKKVKKHARKHGYTVGKRYGAGAVVFCDEYDLDNYEDERYYLLLQAFGQWVLPKGGIDKGESPIQAAKREVREESGLHVEMIKGFKHEIKYPIYNEFVSFGKLQSFDIPKMKIVKFYLGQARSFNVTLSRENPAYTWESYESAVRKIRKKERGILEAAHKFLQSKMPK